MKTSIITRLCVLAASLCLFAGTVGCLEMTPFPEPDASNTVEDLYSMEYRVSMDSGVLHVTFSPETEIYDFIDNTMTDYAGTIDKCEIHFHDDNGVATGLFFQGGDCSQLDSAAARSGDPVTLSFELDGNVVDCDDQCMVTVVLGVTSSGIVPNSPDDLVVDNEYNEYRAPHFNPQIYQNEPQFLDLRTATVVGNCTGSHETWDAASSTCVCDSGYELDSSTMTCVEESDSGPSPDPDPDPDPNPDASEVDTDGDGVPDVDDNCPEISNPGQFDVDNDGVGNVCDVNTTSSESESADAAQWGGGSCSLNAGATSTSAVDILPLLMIASLIAVRRRFR